jgi:multidrug resistance efflux pump
MSTLKKDDLARFQKLGAKRAETFAAFEQARNAFAQAEAAFEGLLNIFAAEYEFDPIQDQISDTGDILKDAQPENVRRARENRRDRQRRISGIL